MNNAAVFAFVVGLPLVATALATSSCDSPSRGSADASTHGSTGGTGGTGNTGGQGAAGGGAVGTGGGTAGAGGETAFTCGAESCTAGQSYCKVVNVLFLESGRRLSAPPDQRCVPFPASCVERTDCSCFQPPASLCDGLDPTCKVTGSAQVTLTCTAGG